MSDGARTFPYDVFISHASEDKDSLVRDLARLLEKEGLKVWYDETTLGIGDRLRRAIDAGLRESRFGVVVLSPAFFSKQWTQAELDGLTTLESDGTDRILPVWHGVEHADVARFSPMLADRLAARTQEGLESVAAQIVAKVRQTKTAFGPTSAMKRADVKRIVDGYLEPRNLQDFLGVIFGRNSDSAQLDTSSYSDCTAQCDTRVILSLVPIEGGQELDALSLLDWAGQFPPDTLEPLAGEDRRPRGDGVIVRHTDYREAQKRYAFISGDAYVEWGLVLGGCFEDLCTVRLVPLLTAVGRLYTFLGDLRERFSLVGSTELVVSVAGTKDTCLADLGRGWANPWDGFRDYRPKCNDSGVQFRRTLPEILTEEGRRLLLFDLDKYLNRCWGSEHVRGHIHPDKAPAATTPIFEPALQAHL